MRLLSSHFRKPLAGLLTGVFLFCGALATPLCGDEFDDALRAVAAVKPHGEGHLEAARAMQVLNQAGPDQIPRILEAMDGAGPIAVNWLRSAVLSAAHRDGQFPQAAVKAYFDDSQHHPLGRLLAFDLMTQDDPAAREAMIPKFVDDPSLPLRYLAIERLIKESEALAETDSQAALGKLALALEKARDVDQIQTIAKSLGKSGIQIDLQKQLGFLPQWHLVGSFDNRGGQGFDQEVGPEVDVTNVDLSAQYSDMEGNPAGWLRVTSDHPTGVVDLNDRIGKVKGATVFAYTEFRAEEARPAEFRIGTPNATKIWLNGKLVMSNEIYHNANSIDKFIGQVDLKQGENQILIKVCQNEQTEDWAQDWQFQFRICDASGKAIAPRAPAATE